MSTKASPAAKPNPDASAPAPAGLAVRQVAWQVLQAVAGGAYADAALERELQRTKLEPADRGLATELAYGAIRQRALLDAWVDLLGKVRACKQPPKLRWLLHLGLYQLLFSDRVPHSAAVSTTVELAKRGGLARLAPVVNGMLRAALRRREELAAGGDGEGERSGAAMEPWRGLEVSDDPAEALALRRSMPPWLTELLLSWLSQERTEAFALACNQAPSLDLRVNPLRASRDQVLATLVEAGVDAQGIDGLAGGIHLSGRSGDLRRLPGFVEGHWCVQDRAAQRIAPLLVPEPAHWVLDACAAPGGKSTHLAELMDDSGTIWAVDRSDARLERVRRNAARLGISSIHTLVAEAQHLAERQPEWLGRFDRILLDAPCSGLGTLARHADARWRVTPDSIEELTALQRQLLEGVLPLLAQHGRLVYATCTVHPAENGALISAFLSDHPELQLLESSQSWPGDPQGGDGFYAAVIERRRPREPAGAARKP